MIKEPEKFLKRIYNQTYYQKHKEREHKRFYEYAKNNREKINKIQRKYREKCRLEK